MLGTIGRIMVWRLGLYTAADEHELDFIYLLVIHIITIIKCDPPREKVPPRGFLTIIYEVNKI